ncbi:MAG: hypothetical protein Q7U04_17065 [Bacteriovorax sp.]|nr:hypothetical protein [Bacteriovorax sp.]
MAKSSLSLNIKKVMAVAIPVKKSKSLEYFVNNIVELNKFISDFDGKKYSGGVLSYISKLVFEDKITRADGSILTVEQVNYYLLSARKITGKKRKVKKVSSKKIVSNSPIIKIVSKIKLNEIEIKLKFLYLNQLNYDNYKLSDDDLELCNAVDLIVDKSKVIFSCNDKEITIKDCLDTFNKLPMV